MSCDPGFYIKSGKTGAKTCTADPRKPTASFKSVPTCTACPPYHFTNDEVGHGKCQEWTFCPPGKGVKINGTSKSDVQCEPCAAARVWAPGDDAVAECSSSHVTLHVTRISRAPQAPSSLVVCSSRLGHCRAAIVLPLAWRSDTQRID